ncbi:hypothetical protein QYF50_26110 [Paenibacillus vini]|uniref:hypothetical protein n=1 Tax=Paenibacillus vini TaxID=1476024 RepID=UPI0025B6C78D|nr:hypothetical protein [Paenibacillus vini]MDN4071371.1 hypothetical protein [Paenibacillus vini]
MDLKLLAKQTSIELAEEVGALLENFEDEPVGHWNIETLEEWVTVYFVLADQGFCYQFNKITGEYDVTFMGLNNMKYFMQLGILN